MDEQALTIIAALAAALWGVYKSSDQWAKHKETKKGKAIDAVFAAVASVYNGSVRGWKAESATGKLNLQQKRTARDRALRKAGEIAMEDGINLLKELAPEAVQHYTEYAVQQLKAKPSPPAG
jgi:hypothetical protein